MMSFCQGYYHSVECRTQPFTVITMAIITSYWFLDIVLALLSVFLGFYINFKLRERKYWVRRNIPYEEPHFLLGNVAENSITKAFHKILEEIYFRNKDAKACGIWLYTRRTILAYDLEIIKNILVKDFTNFHDRGMVYNEETEPLTAHLFNLNGQKWRNLRVKLTPTFTSGKMKMMYDTIYDAGLDLQKYLEEPALKNDTINLKEVLAGFMTDVISSCAFGLNTNSLGNKDCEFRRHGRMVFDPPFSAIITGTLQFIAPWMEKYVTLRQMPKSVSDFFMKAVKDVIQQREDTNTKRKDFMQLLIELKNKGRIEDVDSKYEESDLVRDGDEFTVEQAAAQAFVFLIAGFETSSSASVLTSYELALNPEIQRKVQTEIDNVLKKEGGRISYNALQEMEYLEKIVQEGLRKYPPAPLLFRECTKNCNYDGISFEKGDFIIIPVSGIQNDSRYFPDPERFDPERFSPEAKAERDHFLNLSFGNGPRACIGNRFALLQVKISLVMILSKYNLEVAEKTPIPIVFDPVQFVPGPKGGMPLKITLRASSKN